MAEASLWTRLKERKLVQWAFAYLAGAWVIREVVTGVADSWGWPGVLVRVLDVLLIIGFVSTLVLAWYHGERGRQRATGLELTILAVLLVIAGLGITLVRRGGEGGDRTAPRAAAAGILDPQRIAVLPFRNANESDQESASLALGVHDDLLTRLSTLDGLRVISRTSVEEYRGTTKSIPDIAAELGVGAIIEGGVQRAGDAVRINVQLIDAARDEHLWSETFDRPWSIQNLFAIQSEIAEEVARALRVELTPEDRENLARATTDDEEAFRRYAEALEHYIGFGLSEGMEGAIALARMATARDPNFAEAWALESVIHAAIYFQQERPQDRSPARLEAARAALEVAERLALADADVLVARGNYEYHGHLNYERAVVAFERALETEPSNSRAVMGLAAVRRRQGRMDEAVDRFREAAGLDPRNLQALGDHALTLALARRFPEARARLESFRNIGMLNPELRAFYVAVGLFGGDREFATEYLVDPGAAESQAVAAAALHALWDRDFDGVVNALGAADRPWVQLDAQTQFLPADLVAADAFRFAGRADSARVRYGAAVRRLEVWLEDNPGDERAWSALGRAYAGLGRAEEAVETAERGLELMPYEREAWRGGQRLDDLARVHARLGNEAEAIALLEDLMRKPMGLIVSRASLRAEPEWDGLRGNPRFQALVREGGIP
ncbi:MAG: hypothetical protein ABFS34_10930 [Gemmatimonadota bacterium]